MRAHDCDRDLLLGCLFSNFVRGLMPSLGLDDRRACSLNPCHAASRKTVPSGGFSLLRFALVAAGVDGCGIFRGSELAFLSESITRTVTPFPIRCRTVVAEAPPAGVLANTTILVADVSVKSNV